MLEEFKKDLINEAKCLGDYQSISTDDLANGYCKAKDEKDEEYASYYLSALILRFWYKIGRLWEANTVPNLHIHDFSNLLIEAIDYACKYRVWQDKNKHINAQTAINQCVKTMQLLRYYNYGLQKNKMNYEYVLSLDAPLSYSNSDDGNTHTLSDIIADPEDNYKGNIEAIVYIQSKINNDKIIEAIFLDIIAFNDCEKKEKKIIRDKETHKKHYEYTTSFWPYLVIKNIRFFSTSDDWKKEFISKYDVNLDKFNIAIATIKKANNQKLYSYLNNTIKYCKRDFSEYK